MYYVIFESELRDIKNAGVKNILVRVFRRQITTAADLLEACSHISF